MNVTGDQKCKHVALGRSTGLLAKIYTYLHDITSHLFDRVFGGQQAGYTALKQPGKVSKAEVKVQRGQLGMCTLHHCQPRQEQLSIQ